MCCLCPSMDKASIPRCVEVHFQSSLLVHAFSSVKNSNKLLEVSKTSLLLADDRLQPDPARGSTQRALLVESLRPMEGSSFWRTNFLASPQRFGMSKDLDGCLATNIEMSRPNTSQDALIIGIQKEDGGIWVFFWDTVNGICFAHWGAVEIHHCFAFFLLESDDHAPSLIHQPEVRLFKTSRPATSISMRIPHFYAP